MSSSTAHPVIRHWQGLDRPSKLLLVCLAVSVLLHGIVLSIHFKLPDRLRTRFSSQPLEVTLVNARTKQRPVKADVLAQANLDRGGETEQNVQASTPLPVMESPKPGAELTAAQRRVQELEAKQRELLTQVQPGAKPLASGTAQDATPTEPAPAASGRDLADLARAQIRLQAKIDRQLQEYQKRPKIAFIGSRASEYRFAQYEEDWRNKVERIGTLNFPSEARGKLYGTLMLTVFIDQDGSVAKVELERSSGEKLLDEAAKRIVQMASPYAAFPADIRRDTDQIAITRTWFFGRGDRVWTQ